MGLWSGIKAAGSFLMGGSGQTGLDVVKGVGNWIDEQRFTEQEGAEDRLKRAELYGQYLANTINENTERSRTRRALALLVIRWWLFMLTVCAVLYRFDVEWARFVFDIATATAVGTLVVGIGAFFFGTHLIRERK